MSTKSLIVERPAWLTPDAVETITRANAISWVFLLKDDPGNEYDLGKLSYTHTIMLLRLLGVSDLEIGKAMTATMQEVFTNLPKAVQDEKNAEYIAERGKDVNQIISEFRTMFNRTH